ncbi:MAG TPA: DUF3455 domain-containing protein [Candidatus Binatia bacterium]|jgi:hypothetical protein|nr:DUF3455 domain-containing protein [Candidatus Binatia bacterium]
MNRISSLATSSGRRASSRAALIGAVLAMSPLTLDARPVTPPPVPGDIVVSAEHKPFLIGHAVGTQNYVCLPSSGPSPFAWTLFGPQATVFDDHDRQIATHFLSPNPDEAGTPRARWHSQDSSSVWAVRDASSSDADYVAPGAIPWFRLRVVGTDAGPDGGRRLTETTWLQRINTSGGVAPATGCAQSTDVGKVELIPYAADYVFFKLAARP